MSAIDPTDPQYHYRPIWCVYGPDCFPTMLCCQINSRSGELTIWGYSVYRRSPGFRTLGLELSAFTADRGALFFAEQADALARMERLTTPKVKR